MAIDLMSRIPDREDLDTHEKIVLMIMADRADEEGLLWYANATIARKCSMTVRGVQKVMERLISRRIVRKMHRQDRSNFYIINVEALPRVEPPAKPAKERGPVDFLTGDDEPDLFGKTGEPRSSRRRGRGEHGSGTGERGSDRGEPGSPNPSSDSLNDPESPLGIEIGKHFEQAWNDRLADVYPAIPAIEITKRRRPKLLARIRERVPEDTGDLKAAAIAVIDTLLERIGGSPFLCGEVKEWAISVDWVLGPENFDKTMERRNERQPHGPTGNGRSNLDAGRTALSILGNRRGESGGGRGRAAG